MAFLSSKLGFFLLWRITVCCLCVTRVGLHVRGDAISAQACISETSKPCLAMVGYKASANFNLSHIASLFSLNYTSVLGPNDIDPSVWNLESELVLPAQDVKPYLIPQTCGCIGGTRVVTGVNHTVVDGDTLSSIAAQYFNLVTYTEIANVSGIPNPDQILPGQEMLIPIPCSCLDQTTANALSLSYQVQPGDSLSSIAQLYNTSTVQLQDLNTLANNATSELEAQKVLFVPLPVCKANFSSGAADGNLTVVEGTYELTANNCVQCNCNNGILHCIPTPSSFGTTCSNRTCSSSNGLNFGASNSTQGSQECLVESCVYKGYTTQSGIMASLEVEQDLTCPAAPPPETFYKPPSGLIAAPLESPPATLSSPPPPSTPMAIAPSTTTNPNLVAPLLGGISFVSWWCLLILGFSM